MTFRPHINATASKIKGILNNLILCCKNSFGLSAKNVRLIYLTLIQPIFTYAVGSWWPEKPAQNLLQPYKSIQRLFALRAIRGFNSLSYESALALAGFIPIDIIMEEKRIFFETKTTAKFLALNTPIISTIKLKDLFHPALRNTFTSSNESFPDYRIFSDGSSTNTTSGAGAVLLKCSHPQPIIIRKKLIGVHPIMSPSMTELVAFFLGLQLLEFVPQGASVHMFSDCRFVFSGLKLNKTSTELHLQCFEILNHFSNKLKININWIPGITPEEGLILADNLAKEVRSPLPVDDSFPPSIFCLRTHLRRHSFERWSSRYATTTTSINLKKFFPSLLQLKSTLPSIPLTQINTMILTGHGLLGSHMFKLNLTEHPMCRFCFKQKEDISHIIFQCEELKDERKKLATFMNTKFKVSPNNLYDFSSNSKSIKHLLSWIKKILKPPNTSNFPY